MNFCVGKRTYFLENKKIKSKFNSFFDVSVLKLLLFAREKITLITPYLPFPVELWEVVE